MSKTFNFKESNARAFDIVNAYWYIYFNSSYLKRGSFILFPVSNYTNNFICSASLWYKAINVFTIILDARSIIVQIEEKCKLQIELQVETGPLRFIHVRIHADLTGEVHVVEVQIGKTMGDPLEYF